MEDKPSRAEEETIKDRIIFKPKIAIFIDDQNLSSYVRNQTIGNRIDYSRLLDFFGTMGYIVSANLYKVDFSDLPENIDKPDKASGFYSFLRRYGFRVRLKMAKPTFERNTRERKGTKGNCDVEIAVDAALLAASGRVDEIVLFSGDDDFCWLMEKIRDLGVRAVVVGPREATSANLRESSDEYVDLEDIWSHFLEPHPRFSLPRMAEGEKITEEA